MALDLNAIQQRLDQLNEQNNRSNSGGFDFLTLQDGRNVVRILPSAKDGDFPWREVFVHFGVGKTKDKPKGQMVVCPTTLGDSHKCPICELSKQLRALSSAKDDKRDKEAKAIMRKKRVYYNAINRADDLTAFTIENDEWVNTATKEKEKPVKVLSTGVSVFKELLGYLVDPEYGDFTDAENGLDIIITKTGSGFDTEYSTKTARKESAVGFAQWQDCLNDLDALAKPKSYEEIKAIMEGVDTPDMEEEENLGTPAPSSAPNTPPVQEPTEEDSEIDDEIAAALARRRNK